MEIYAGVPEIEITDKTNKRVYNLKAVENFVDCSQRVVIKTVERLKGLGRGDTVDILYDAEVRDSSTGMITSTEHKILKNVILVSINYYAQADGLEDVEFIFIK